MAKQIKIDPYCQRRNCNPLYVLFSGVQISLIFPWYRWAFLC